MFNAERGTRNLFLTVLVLSLTPTAARAQAGDTSYVYQHAHVRAQVPSLGGGWLYGSFAHARSSMGTCLGVGLILPKYPKDTMVVMIGGLKVLEVDRRTNSNIYALGLTPPADSDWQAVDLKALAEADSGCKKGR